jgi:predicted RNase H-like HicB family nuclease
MHPQPRYRVVIEWSDADQAYIASVPDLPGCAADGANYAEAAANVPVVIAEWIETAAALGRPIPKEHPQAERYSLRGTVLRYVDPMAPVAEDDWEVLRGDAGLAASDRDR